MEEVRKEAERLKLKEKAVDLAEAANLKKNKKKGCRGMVRSGTEL